ncbi:lysozyme inhibitor LprI family protein [uncultured Sphingomonas sp.]|uniref:lysozyme inhibitor LprI family protein n=1 Tax=uncultured Sphingomonas sp. TaxID=158754 RepID=UPI0025EB9113|nr:lysozyme inhibitor LprI family protein [uncultured Sphingomonas sp.]
MSIIIAALLLAAGNQCAGSTTRDVEQCLAADLDRADAELNRYYAAATKRLSQQRDTAALAKLRTAERAWIVYRDAECDAVYESWGQGTIRGAMNLGCRITLTEARTATIWRNWLTYADSTLPILPKPRASD